MKAVGNAIPTTILPIIAGLKMFLPNPPKQCLIPVAAKQPMIIT